MKVTLLYPDREWGREKLYFDREEIVKDLNADSLDVVELLMNLEEEYGGSISDEDAIKIKTVGDVVDAINNMAK